MDHSGPRPGCRFVARMETDKGAMRIALYPDRAPRTVASFVNLARQGFYDGLGFHRVIRGFMIQGGCPRGDGTGGPGFNLPAEFNDLAHEKGVISMARGKDPDSAGCQFFIVHGSHAAHLDGAYTAFGRVEEGFDVLDAIAQVQVDWNGSERSRPREPVKIRSIAIEEQELGAAAEPAREPTEDALPDPGAAEARTPADEPEAVDPLDEQEPEE